MKAKNNPNPATPISASGIPSRILIECLSIPRDEKIAPAGPAML
jgi:hypothetical protein